MITGLIIPIDTIRVVKKLQLALKLSKLSDITHIWFPCPVDEDKKAFDVSVTQMQVDKFSNKIAYFKLEKVNKIEIRAQFAVSSHQIAKNICKTDKFLISSESVQADDKQIVKIAQDLTKDKRANEEIAQACFDWVVSYLKYANPIPGLYSALQSLTDRKVDCGGFAALLVALLRATKIPARCVFGWTVQSKHGYHAWAEYFDRQKQKWISMDPSIAHLGQRTKLKAGFGFINDERMILSVGEDIELKGDDKFTWTTPLLQLPLIVSLNKQLIHQQNKAAFADPKISLSGKVFEYHFYQPVKSRPLFLRK